MRRFYDLYRKNCSGYKLKEMTGSGIFNDKGKVGSESDATDPKTGLRYYQVALLVLSYVSTDLDKCESKW